MTLLSRLCQAIEGQALYNIVAKAEVSQETNLFLFPLHLRSPSGFTPFTVLMLCLAGGCVSITLVGFLFEHPAQPFLEGRSLP